MDARVLRLFFTLVVLLSSSYSLFSPLTIGRGSKNNVEESKITEQLQSNLLKLDQFFQSPIPAARFLTPQTYTPLSLYFLLSPSLPFPSLPFSSLLFSSFVPILTSSKTLHQMSPAYRGAVEGIF